MKKAIVLLAVLATAAAFSLAFTGQVFAMPENGITVFEPAPAASPATHAAWEPGIAMDNGVTIFARGPISYDSGMAALDESLVSTEGSAAGGLSTSEGLKVENGITIFYPK